MKVCSLHIFNFLEIKTLESFVKSCRHWQRCSITSEALLWILCSWRSNDIQAILAICRTRVSRTQEARNWTTLFQDVKIECIKFRLNTVWVGKATNVKDFGDVTLAWEDEKWFCIVWKLQMKGKVLWLVGKATNVKDFGDVTLAWEDEKWFCIVWKLQMKGKVLWLEGCYPGMGRYKFIRWVWESE